jgi:hypothetical protein
MGVYRVLYASSQRHGCFIETLARFSVDVSFITDLALMENCEDDFTALGTVRRAWIKGRCIRIRLHQTCSGNVFEKRLYPTESPCAYLGDSDAVLCFWRTHHLAKIVQRRIAQDQLERSNLTDFPNVGTVGYLL